MHTVTYLFKVMWWWHGSNGRMRCCAFICYFPSWGQALMVMAQPDQRHANKSAFVLEW